MKIKKPESCTTTTWELVINLRCKFEHGLNRFETISWCDDLVDVFGFEQLELVEECLRKIYDNGKSMVSDDIYDEIDSYIKKVNRFLPPSDITQRFYEHKSITKISNYLWKRVSVTPKYDGVSAIITITPEDIFMTTKMRNDKCRNIKHRVQYLSCYPQLLQLKKSIEDRTVDWLEIKLMGELVVPLSTLEEESRPNARALSTSFVLSSHTPTFTIDFVIFNAQVPDFLTYRKLMTKLSQFNLDVAPSIRVIINPEAYHINFWKELASRFTLDYNIDGLVATNSHKDVEFAIKFITGTVQSTVKDIQWEKHGNKYFPTALINPTVCNGKIFKRVSMSCYKKLVTNNVHIGATISCLLVGDSILTFSETLSTAEEANYNLPEGAIVDDKMNLIEDDHIVTITLNIFRTLIKYYDVVSIGIKTAQEIYNALRDTSTIDALITSLEEIKDSSNKIELLLENFQTKEIYLHQALTLIPMESTSCKTQTILKYFSYNPEIVPLIEQGDIGVIKDNLHQYPCFGSKKLKEIEDRITTLIHWGVQKLKIKFELPPHN